MQKKTYAMRLCIYLRVHAYLWMKQRVFKTTDFCLCLVSTICFQTWRFPNWGYPQIIHFHMMFYYKPSVFGVPAVQEAPYFFDLYPLMVQHGSAARYSRDLRQLKIPPPQAIRDKIGDTVDDCEILHQLVTIGRYETMQII